MGNIPTELVSPLLFTPGRHSFYILVSLTFFDGHLNRGISQPELILSCPDVDTQDTGHAPHFGCTYKTLLSGLVTEASFYGGFFFFIVKDRVSL